VVMNYLKTIWFVPTNSFHSQSNNTSLKKKRNVLPIKMIRVKGGITIIPGLTRMNNKLTSHIVSFIFCLIRLIFSYANIQAFNNWLVHEDSRSLIWVENMGAWSLLSHLSEKNKHFLLCFFHLFITLIHRTLIRSTQFVGAAMVVW
jgi:hypothetical protein